MPVPAHVLRAVNEQMAANAAAGGGRLAKLNALRGEWWFDDGRALFADGDRGDMDHTGYVIDSLSHDLLEAVDLDTDDEFNNAAERRDDVAQALGLDREYDKSELGQALVAKLVSEHEWPPEKAEDAFQAIFGRLDPRDYGTKHLGWQRVHGNSIQTWNLDAGVLKNIAAGINDAALDDIDGSGDDIEHEVFDIEVQSQRKLYSNVPWDVLERGDMKALRDYLQATY